MYSKEQHYQELNRHKPNLRLMRPSIQLRLAMRLAMRLVNVKDGDTVCATMKNVSSSLPRYLQNVIPPTCS
jgi:hypothetical protein